METESRSARVLSFSSQTRNQDEFFFPNPDDAISSSQTQAVKSLLPVQKSSKAKLFFPSSRRHNLQLPSSTIFPSFLLCFVFIFMFFFFKYIGCRFPHGYKEELQNEIILTVKQSAALNRAGAENMKPRQLSDAIYDDRRERQRRQREDEGRRSLEEWVSKQREAVKENCLFHSKRVVSLATGARVPPRSPKQ